MSAFKRYRSKVFWSQMESQDLGDAFPSPGKPVRAERVSSSLEEPVELLGNPESDTTDPENVTVIHIDLSPSTDRSEENAAGLAERGQPSQDSGFSDSERSDSSADGQSPRRRRRRRSGRQRNRARGLVGPTTSTPKREARPAPRRTVDQQLPRQLEFSLDGTEEATRGLGSSNSAEGLEDFLFASEPPEEEAAVEVAPTPRRRLKAVVSEGLDVRAPVKAWLGELIWEAEDECMATLQSKSLPRRRLRDEEPESRDLRLLTASAATAAKKVIDVAARFDERYQRVIDSLNRTNGDGIDVEAIESIEDEATEILLKLGSTQPRRLIRQDNPRNVAGQLTRLKMNVDRALDRRLDFYIEKVVLGLEEAPREGGSAARGALAALTALGLAGSRAGASLARCSGIRALLTSLVSSGRLSSVLRSACLRALASVCCCLEAVDQFVSEGGPEILADVLAAPAAPHAERSEATALLVQITAPWMDYVGLPYLEIYGQALVRALTDLAEGTDCKQTLLLAAAALNHLSHSRRCVGPIIACNSIKKLLRCVKKSSGGSVWLMEQVASLVGQVARVPQARAHLAETRASVALVCFLRMQPPGLEDEYRRLEATASEALTRLCVDPEMAKQVVAVGGSNFLPADECTAGPRRCAPLDQAFHSTKSLRVARKIAAEQIDLARMWDTSPR